MYEEIFKRITEAAQNNSLTFFVGAGVSAVSGAPKWSDLIDSMCLELGDTPKGKYTSDECLRIPQMYYYSINQDNKKYYSFVSKNLKKVKLLPNDIHKMLLRFNPCSFVTTNFDELLEEAAIQNAQSFKSIACDSEISSINGDKYILKLHGDLKHKNIVLKEEDYLNYSENFKLIETVLKAVFSMNTVVFIGYGLNDYNIKLVLNWAKTLLKDQFNEPIFIYTDSDELSKETLLYHESKGLKVIECKNFIKGFNKDTPYIDRYISVLQAINSYSMYSFDGKSDVEAFEIICEFLRPLNQLRALRIQDIREKIGKYVYIRDDGVISPLPYNENVLKKFIEISSLQREEREKIEKSVLEKYEIISTVFLKAGITNIEFDKSFIKIDGTCEFADLYCTSFNYMKMDSYCKIKTTNKFELYKKAYYLTRLMRFEEAYFLFLKVAKDAFKEKNYLLYYLAQVNCNNLCNAIKHADQYYGCFNLKEIEKSALSEEQIRKLFDGLPVEFKNKYDSLKDLNSSSLLYKYSYNAFVDGQKLQNAIESNSLEFGLSSGGKAVCRINEYLNFLVANGLFLDSYEEFRKTVSNLMSLLIYKYSEQEKKKLAGEDFLKFSSGKVVFDDIDFYCFIEYFNSDSMIKLFKKYDIDTIEFENMDKICQAINNLIEYYEKVVLKSNSVFEKIEYQVKIKKCLTLLRYIDIPQEIVDKVCKFIFSYDFRDILIDDKILFLDKQLYKKRKYSCFTRKIVEDALIDYIDMHIKSIEKGRKFEVFSATSGINYYNLVQYISPEKEFHSKRLSLRVSKIIKLKDTTMLNHVAKYYINYVSFYQRAKVIALAKKSLEKNFDFQLLSLLIGYNAKINDDVINKLQMFLYQQIENKQSKKSIQVFPPIDCYEELNQVAYWCFLGNLKKENFSCFLGKSNLFVFFYLYNKFDFSKFDVSWLLFFTKPVLISISKNAFVRNKIRSNISNVLMNERMKATDEKRLSKILVEYFC